MSIIVFYFRITCTGVFWEANLIITDFLPLVHNLNKRTAELR